MSIFNIFQRIVSYFLIIIILFTISNVLIFPVNMLKDIIGEYPGQIVFAFIVFIIFMIINYVKISKNPDLRREITAIINKSEKEFNLRDVYSEYMKIYGITEIISFMATIFIIILLYVNINLKIDNIMNEVFIHMYNIIKFIYSNDSPLGSFNVYIILNFILISILFTIGLHIIMINIIKDCEKNRFHKNIKK